MERKVNFSISGCSVGMKIAEPIFNHYGAVIIPENAILDALLIEKLEKMGIDKIKVYKEDIETPKVKAIQEYNMQVESVKDVLKDISEGKNLDLDRIAHVADDLIVKFNESKNVLSCIKQIRTADEYTYNHCVNVSLLAMLIGTWMKMDAQSVKDLVYAGLLHDIGKAKIPLNILNKPGKLTPAEYEVIKLHVAYAKELLAEMPDINSDIIAGVIMHHEREDGSGYLLGLKNEQIHPFAKIIAVADVYDAMTSNRVYRDKQNPFDVFEHIRISTYKGLDPNVGLTFLQHIASYYIGDFCKLNSGEVGEIIQISARDVSRPLIRIDNTYVDLIDEPDLKIEELL